MREERRRGFFRKGKKRQCVFCKTRREPYYLDLETLEGFMSDTKRILPRRLTGACARHQRRVTKAIRRARFLGFMPYVPGV